MAKEALELWAEGMQDEGLPLPEPHDFSKLRADPKRAESFEDAAFVIAVEPPWSVQRKAAE